MTVTKPLKKQHAGFFIVIGALLAIGGVLVIQEYNELVGVRYERRSLQDGIVEEELRQADLKNDLFQITDPNTLQNKAQISALILEENPEYLEVGGGRQVSALTVR